MKEASIILPTYAIDADVEAKEERFLDSLDATLPYGHWTTRRFELIVIDNGTPGDRIGLRIDDMADHYIHIDHPIGHARAANIGMALADCHYIINVSNDLVLSEGWFDKLIEEYKAQGPGVVSPMDSSDHRQGLHASSWYALWMTDRDVITNIGYLDEVLNQRYADQDHCIRMVKAGYKVLQTSAVKIKHDASSTYYKMLTDPAIVKNEERERRVMHERYGCDQFTDWMARNGRSY